MSIVLWLITDFSLTDVIHALISHASEHRLAFLTDFPMSLRQSLGLF